MSFNFLGNAHWNTAASYLTSYEFFFNLYLQKIIISQPSKHEVEKAKQEQSTLQDSIRLSLQNLDKLQGQQVELQTEVDTLRNESQRLQNRIRYLGVAHLTWKDAEETM